MRRPVLARTVVITALLFVVLFVYPGRGRQPPYPLLHTDASTIDAYDHVSPDALAEDIDFYVSSIAAAHADPNHFITEEAFRETAQELKSRLRAEHPDSVTLLDSYYYLQELAASIQDEHTDIRFPQRWREHLAPTFPLHLRIIDDRVYVEKDAGANGIPRYAEILSIDGRSVAEMLPEILRFQNNTLYHYKLQAIQEDFDLWLQGYFGLRAPWTVEYRHRDRVSTTAVRGITIDDYRDATRRDEAYSESLLTVGNDTVPVLEIPKFWYDDKKSYERFIDDLFNAHQDKSYLVLDLRRNPGGAGAWGLFVLDYLTDAEYQIQKRFAHKVSDPYKEIVRWTVRSSYHDAWIPRLLWWLPLHRFTDHYFKDVAGRLLQADNGTYVEVGDEFRDPNEGKARFRGTVFLLTSHYTNSAAVVVAAAFKAGNMGLIVGQETGGRVSFSSDPIFVELPNTALRAVIPVAILTLPGDNPSRGVLPDIPVEYSLDDYMAQRDRELDTVRQLVEAELTVNNPAAVSSGRR